MAQFRNNRCLQGGGALLLFVRSNSSIASTTFSQNVASVPILAYVYALVELFVQNGGAVLASLVTTLNIAASNFTRNSAELTDG